MLKSVGGPRVPVPVPVLVHDKNDNLFNQKASVKDQNIKQISPVESGEFPLPTNSPKTLILASSLKGRPNCWLTHSHLSETVY